MAETTGTAFTDYNDYDAWYNEYVKSKVNEVAEKYDVTFSEAWGFLTGGRKSEIPQGYGAPSRMMNTVFDECDDADPNAQFGKVDIKAHTKEEGAAIIDEKFDEALYKLDAACKYKSEHPESESLRDSYETVVENGDYKYIPPEEREQNNSDTHVNSQAADIGKTDLPADTTTGDGSDSGYYFEIPDEYFDAEGNIILPDYLQGVVDTGAPDSSTGEYLKEIPKEYNWNQVDVFNRDVGRIVTGNDWGFAPLNTMYEEVFNEYDKEVINNTDWNQKTDQMLANADQIIKNFEDFAEQFDSISGELGAALAENLNLSLEDLKTLKTYMSDNLTNVTYYVEELKKNMTAKDELEKEIEAKTTEKNELEANKVPETLPCTHTNEQGEKQHPGGDPNPAYTTWQEKLTDVTAKLTDLEEKLKVTQDAILICLKNVEVYDSVVVKFTESPQWQKYTSGSERVAA